MGYPIYVWDKYVYELQHNDKLQLIALFTCTLSGKIPSTTSNLSGKTPVCLPTVKFPDDWNVIFTPDHWPNEETMMIQFSSGTLRKHALILQLRSTRQALVIFNQQTSSLHYIARNNISLVEVLTDQLQPLDFSIK